MELRWRISWYGTAGAAVVNKGDKTWLINGEAKPGLRTDAVFELDFTGDNLKWNKLAPVASPDGVAGGFAGISNDSLIFAGGPDSKVHEKITRTVRTMRMKA